MTPRAAHVALALACTASAVTLVVLGTRLTFFNDDWAFVIQQPGLLDEHNGHLSLLPIAVYRVLVALVGLDTQWPFRVLLAATVVALGVVVYLLVAERVGRAAGVVAATLLMFLGPAWEDLLWSFQIGFVGSMATGLGALLALEHGRDRLACALLVVSVACSDLALTFVVAAAIAVMLRRPRTGWWVPVAPALLFGAWFLAYGRQAPSHITTGNLANVPDYVGRSVSSGVEALLGLADGGWFEALRAPSWLLLVLTFLLVAVWFMRGARPTPGVLVFAGGALAFWILAGANAIPGREPEASRYQLVHATFLVLIAAELLRGVQVPRPAAATALAAAVVVLGSNLAALRTGYDFMRLHAENARAALGALDLARATASRDLRLTEQAARDPYLWSVTAREYYEQRDAHGSPAWSAGEIAAGPAAARQTADSVLVAARQAHAAVAAETDGCRVLGDDVLLPKGDVVVANRDAATALLKVRRFARTSTPVALVPGGGAVRISIAGRAPWRLDSQARGLQLCRV